MAGQVSNVVHDIQNLIDKSAELDRSGESDKADKLLEQIKDLGGSFVTKARKLTEEGLNADEGGFKEQAVRLYREAVGVCLEAARATKDREARTKYSKLAEVALERAEWVKDQVEEDFRTKHNSFGLKDDGNKIRREVEALAARYDEFKKRMEEEDEEENIDEEETGEEEDIGQKDKMERSMSWEDIQRNTFKRWLNTQLKHTDLQVSDLQEDLSDGLVLISVVERLAGRKMGKYNKTANFRVKKIENVSIALKFLEDDEGISLVNMDAMDIVDGKMKLILGLVWTLILHYSISKANYGDVKDEHVLQTPKQRLMGWIGDQLPQLNVTNFKEDWQDGKAVGALVEAVAPGLLPDWEDWNTDNPEEVKNNVEEAMEVAETWLGVPQLLTAEEILNPEVDELSVMTYVAEFTKAKLKDGAPLKQVNKKVEKPNRKKAPVYDDDFPEKHFRGLWELCEIMINS